MTLRTTLLMAMLLAVTTFATPGHAIVITSSVGTSTSTAGASTQIDFDAANGALVSSVTGLSLNGGTDPGGGGNWASVSSGSLTVTFNTLLDYFGFLWGTLQGSNHVSFFNGSTSIAGPYNNHVGTGSFVNFTASSVAEHFNKIEFANMNGQCCFAFDNIAARAAAPVSEPSTLLTLIGVIGLLGLTRRYV